MKYTLPKAGYARTSDYQGTTTDYKNDPDVLALKESVARNNAQVREQARREGRIIGTLGRVRVKGRGPRNHSFYHTQLNDATHYDIYAGEDTAAMDMLREELETGMTASEQRACAELRWQIMQIQTKGKMRLRKRQANNPYRGTGLIV